MINFISQWFRKPKSLRCCSLTKNQKALKNLYFIGLFTIILTKIVDPLAQLVEHLTLTLTRVSSNLTGAAIFIKLQTNNFKHQWIGFSLKQKFINAFLVQTSRKSIRLFYKRYIFLNKSKVQFFRCCIRYFMKVRAYVKKKINVTINVN